MRKSLFFLLLLSAILPGCRREGPLSWDTGLLAPLASTTLTIDNLVPDSLLVQNPDSSIKLVYSNDFFQLSSDSIYEIPDTTLTNVYYIPLGSTQLAPSDPITTNATQQTTYSLSGIDLVQAILRGGKMLLTLKNDVTQPISLTYEVPCATLNGIPFDTTIIVPAAPSATQAAFSSLVIDLAGYNIDLRGLNGDRVNTIVTRFSSAIAASATGIVTITPQDSVSIINTFQDIEPYYVRGYFGNSTIAVGPEESEFSIFKKVTNGSLLLENLTMSLEIDNFVGMDAQLYINSIYSRNTHTGNVVNLSAPMIGQSINFNRATTTNGWLPVTPHSMAWTLDNNNSNAKQLVENLPDKLGYDVSIVTNPLGNVSGSNDFFFVDYPLRAKLNVEMPLSFIADDLTLTDTLRPSFAGVQNPEDLLGGTLTLYADNGFPFSAGMQVYLLDAFGQLTDSLIAAPALIASAPVMLANTSPQNTWRAQGKTKTVLRIPLSETQTQALLASSKLVVRSIFNTDAGPSHTRIYSSDALDLKLTADFNYRQSF